MIDLPKPGAYVVRAPHANHFSQGLVQHWLGSQEETPATTESVEAPKSVEAPAVKTFEADLSAVLAFLGQY